VSVGLGCVVLCCVLVVWVNTAPMPTMTMIRPIPQTLTPINHFTNHPTNPNSKNCDRAVRLVKDPAKKQAGKEALRAVDKEVRHLQDEARRCELKLNSSHAGGWVGVVADMAGWLVGWWVGWLGGWVGGGWGDLIGVGGWSWVR
jgi:hypothetical protein